MCVCLPCMMNGLLFDISSALPHSPGVVMQRGAPLENDCKRNWVVCWDMRGVVCLFWVVSKDYPWGAIPSCDRLR